MRTTVNPIDDDTWAGLAGAERFPNGERPAVFELLIPGSIHVIGCCDPSGLQVHEYDPDECELVATWVFPNPKPPRTFAEAERICHKVIKAGRLLGWADMVELAGAKEI